MGTFLKENWLPAAIFVIGLLAILFIGPKEWAPKPTVQAAIEQDCGGAGWTDTLHERSGAVRVVRCYDPDNPDGGNAILVQ